MEKQICATLKGGFTSKVLFFSSLDKLFENLEPVLDNSLFVFDENTRPLINKEIKNEIVLKSGESEKKWESIDKILSKASSLSLARDSYFIAVGGGVITDMTAFASSIYMRGANIVLVPTTLLCMVDATLGGKTGIDYKGLKNFVGSFYPAEKILISTSFLLSLSFKEYVNGLGEVIKHALLSKNSALFDFLKNEKDSILSREEKTLNEIVALSLEVKKEFIEKDPEEKKGIRSFLNFGHTFAHALESVTSYSVSHGEAVMWGMGRALDAGLILGVTDKDFYKRATSLLNEYPFEMERRVKKDELELYLTSFSKDKKKSSGSVKSVLMVKQGEPILSILDEKIVKEVVS